MKKLFGGFGMVVLVVIGIAIMGAFMIFATFLSALIFKCILWAQPFIGMVDSLAFWTCVVVLLPTFFIQRTRNWFAECFGVASVIFFASLWAQGFVDTYTLWGPGAVVLGMFVLGVGVVPFAFVACVLKGQWSALFGLMALLALAVGTRAFGTWAATMKRRRAIPSTILAH